MTYKNCYAEIKKEFHVANKVQEADLPQRTSRNDVPQSLLTRTKIMLAN